jgi:AcrR family transcriptional regulator
VGHNELCLDKNERSCDYLFVSKGDETRSLILDQALAQASEVGLEALSIGGLARDMGLSKSGLFGHFESKENLQLEILEMAAERFVQQVIAPALKEPRGIPRVRALFESWLAWERSPSMPGGCVFMAVANELDDRPGPVRDRLVAYQRDMIEALVTAAGIAVSERHFRPDADPRQFAYDLYSIVLAYHHFSRLMDDPDAEARARRAFATLLEHAAVGGE